MAAFILPESEQPVQVARDQVRRLHRDLVDDAGQAQDFEQRDGADDDRDPVEDEARHASSSGARPLRPMVLIDSSRSVFHRRAVMAPNSLRSTMRLSRSRGQRGLDNVDQAPRPRRHHADAVGQHRRLVEGMRDEEDRRAGLAPHAQQLVAHQQARLLVERAEGLVE